VIESNGIRLRLGTPVRAVTWEPDEALVEAVAQGAPYRVRARRVILTLPLGVLQAAEGQPGAVRFTPALDVKREALDRLVMGDVLKVLLRFREPFWETIVGGRYRDAAFFHAQDQDFPTFWTVLPDRAPVLVAWTGGPRAERLSRMDDAQITRTALGGVEALFGAGVDPAGLLLEAHVHNWQRDPFSRGAYSYVAVGGRRARGTLAAALDNTLFFAGEATDDTGEGGTIAGALASGERAAHQVLSTLERRRS
jgi:monoamine oxidase